MSDQPSKLTIAETKDVGLIARAYNLGLKAVSNFQHVLDVCDLEYWEKNILLLKAGVATGFVRRERERNFLPKTERMIENISLGIGKKIKNLSHAFRDGRISENYMRKEIDDDVMTLINSLRASLPQEEKPKIS